MSERERFEAWAHGKSWSTSRYSAKAVKGGAYRNWHVEAAWLAWQARCPEGWQVVPVEATEVMTDNVIWAAHDNTARCIYTDMLAAAPQPGEES